MTTTEFPVIGSLTPWDGGIQPTKFQKFECGGIHGLAFASGKDLEIMAIVAYWPGFGHFRDFVMEAKEHYDSIRFWAVLGGNLSDAAMAKILPRYGFTEGRDIDEYGEMTDCWDWSKELPLMNHKAEKGIVRL